MVLEVELPVEQLDRSVADAVSRLARRTRVAGFRPGKAPRTILERVLGPGAVLEEALDHLVPASLEEALGEAQVIPLDRPRVEVIQGEEGKPLLYRATVSVRPQVKLGDYRNFPFGIEVEPVDEARVAAVLEELRGQQGTLVAVEDRPVREGDYLVIGFEGRRDGQPFDGGSAERYPLIAGAGRMLPGFEEAVLGMALDEQKSFDLTLPEDYSDGTLAGQPVTFTVTVREIREKVLPELDDAFAQGVGDFADLAALRADLERRLEATARDRARHRFADRIIEYAVANATLELPDPLVDAEVEVMHDELRVRLAEQGIGYEDYLNGTGKDEAALHGEFRPRAEQRVKVLLVLSAIADAEGVDVADEEVEAEIARVRARQERNPKLISYFDSPRGRGYLRSTMRRSAVVERLVDAWLAAHPEVGPVPHLEEDGAVAAGTPGAAVAVASRPA